MRLPAIVWDQHTCATLRPDADLSPLSEFRRNRADFVSLNVGVDFSELGDVLRTIAGFRAWLEARAGEFRLVATVDDVLAAREQGKLAVAFDLEGIAWIGSDLDLIDLLAQEGVRTMALTYNATNAFASGCAGEDTGLTTLGRDAVAAMNAAGVVVDCSHTARRATLQIMEISASPVIFSHSNPATVWPHFRNIDDDQIRACAATGGVIGINGVNWFLGSREASAEAIVREIEYVGELVGFDHVGIGLDYLFDRADADVVIAAWPELVDQRIGEFSFAGPDALPEIERHLLAHGYDTETARKVMGGNFLRVASSVWAG